MCHAIKGNCFMSIGLGFNISKKNEAPERALTQFNTERHMPLLFTNKGMKISLLNGIYLCKQKIVKSISFKIVKWYGH
jgi:hypothetical protein